ncbi:hypothetical protein C8R47DRAFT_1155461 [Mycena vitilis]|nr:hypothetical protein C8R47DRAFT_1155461 [Mycena vitilis]
MWARPQWTPQALKTRIKSTGRWMCSRPRWDTLQDIKHLKAAKRLKTPRLLKRSSSSSPSSPGSSLPAIWIIKTSVGHRSRLQGFKLQVLKASRRIKTSRHFKTSSPGQDSPGMRSSPQWDTAQNASSPQGASRPQAPVQDYRSLVGCTGAEGRFLV